MATKRLQGYDPSAPERIKVSLDAQLGRFDVDQQQEWATKLAALRSTTVFQIADQSGFTPVRTFSDYELTPAKAKYLDENFNKFLGQRKRTVNRLDMIATAIEAKTWHGGKIVIALSGEDYVMENGIKTRTLLVNGGTTIGACVQYGLTAKYNVLQFVWCPTNKDVSDLYMTFDRPESTRSATDRHKAVLAARDDLQKWRDGTDQHLRSRVFSNCLTASMVAKFGPSYRSKKMTEKEKNLFAEETYTNEMYWLMDYIYNDPKTPMYLKKVVGVLGPMLHSHYVWGDACQLFWDDLKAGWAEGLSATNRHRMNPLIKQRSPQAALLQYLVGLQSGPKEDEHTVHGKVMTAMNAWASGKKTFSFQGRRANDPSKNDGWDRVPIEMAYFHPHPANMPEQHEVVE